jgi:glycosyltransferase involved in cell wall biosynthesis
MVEYLTEISCGAVLLYIFLLALVIQLYHYLFVYLRLAIYKKKAQTSVTPPVSVIICARNEEENLTAFLPDILEQDYPQFEVIVVNDCSFDKSIDVLKSFAHRYSNLKVADIKEVAGREHGKKFALTIGIKAASHETLLLTDADCRPESKSWIRNMVSAYTPGKELVLAYGKYAAGKGLLNNVIRYDAFFIAVQYLSLALKQQPYMGVGRNLSYHRQLFFAVKGFASHMHIDSGDDDLFVSQVAQKQNTAIAIGPEATTVSLPKKTWRSWFLQKKRHHATAHLYSSAQKFNIALYPLSWYIFTLSAIAGMFYDKNMLILTFGVFLRAMVQITILHSASNKLGESGLSLLSPVIEFIHRLFVYPIYLLSTMFIKQRKWN